MPHKKDKKRIRGKKVKDESRKERGVEEMRNISDNAPERVIAFQKQDSIKQLPLRREPPTAGLSVHKR